MFVVAKHEIRDPKAFFEKGSALVKNLPPGMNSYLFLPNKDMTWAVCLWEADSIEPIKTLLDTELGPYSRNEYYEVDSVKADGLEHFGVAAAR